MRRLSAELGIPVSFLILQASSAPDLWREQLDACVAAEADGAGCAPRSRTARSACCSASAPATRS